MHRPEMNVYEKQIVLVLYQSLSYNNNNSNNIFLFI